MLSRQLRYSVDSFAAFFRLGAECWGPRSAKPELELKLASEDPVKKEARLKLEEELCSKAIKRKENLALSSSQESETFRSSAGSEGSQTEGCKWPNKGCTAAKEGCNESKEGCPEAKED